MSIGFGQLLIILLLILLLLGKFPNFVIEINKGLKSLKNLLDSNEVQNNSREDRDSLKIESKSKSKKNSNL